MKRDLWLFFSCMVMLGVMGREGFMNLQSNPESGNKIVLSSAAFGEGAMIPKEYACDGKNMSPPLEWSGIPDGTQSLALICDDPDAPAGTWVHWVIYEMPSGLRGLKAGIPPEPILADKSVQGTNDFRKIGYGGPCPPGGIHRYFFKLYALDSRLSLKPGATQEALKQAMQGHILGQASLMGRYRR